MSYSLKRSIGRGADQHYSVDLLVDEVGEGRLAWQARRVFDAIGFEERGKETSLSKVWKREFVKWTEWCASVGYDSNLCSGRSIKSLQALGSNTKGAKDTFWLETKLLLLVLTAYSLLRQSGTDKQRCRDMLTVLLQFCSSNNCQPPDACHIENKVLCFDDLDDSGFCRHVRDHQEGQWSQRVDRVLRWQECTTSLFQRRTCPACAGELRMALDAASQSMWAQRASWGSQPSAAGDLTGPSGKRRKVEHSRIEAKLQEGTLALPTMRQLWSRDITSMLQEGARIFGATSHLASCFDGGRCGKPARDYNFHWLLAVEDQ
eukprot:2132503-Amphidinium_carterae.1